MLGARRLFLMSKLQRNFNNRHPSLIQRIYMQKFSSPWIIATALILWGCGESGDSASNVPNDTGDIMSNVPSSSSQTSSIFCNDGETFTNGIETYTCLEKKWIKQEVSQQCIEEETFTNGTLNYICLGGQWITLEQPSQPSSYSSSAATPIETTISSSSINESFSSSEIECTTNRYAYVQDTNTIATAASIYKELKRTYIYDICQNGKLKYPSNICDYAVPGQAVPSENRVINGISYHVWCYGGIPYFDLACSKEEEGVQDTVIIDGTTFRTRKCVFLQGMYSWAQQGNDLSNLSIITDSRDKKNYKTVKIGSQTWMAENLNYEISGSYCYNDSASYCAKYGRLYPWSKAGYVCPEGFHLPDSSEWAILCAATGGTCEKAGQELAAGTWIYTDLYDTSTFTGLNTYGFAALPAGMAWTIEEINAGRYTYAGFGYNAQFWSKTTAKDYVSNGVHYEQAYSFGIYPISARIESNDPSDRRSVRCVKD